MGTTVHSDFSGAYDLQDTQWPEQVDEGADLLFTFTSVISRSTWGVPVKSFTWMTPISLLSCFSICPTIRSSPRVTSVMRDIVGSSVSATVRLSILKARALKRPATRERTPNSFSTRTEIVCRTMCSWYSLQI